MLLTTIRQKAPRRSGFTLMEVLVVVAILVILAGVAIIAVPKYIEDARKSKAHLACKSIAQACEAYKINAANSTGDYPQSIDQLITPPFGGSSYLLNGQDDIKDPWGQPYHMEVQTKSDGITQYMFVHTTARDKSDVSNFGIGPLAKPNF